MTLTPHNLGDGFLFYSGSLAGALAWNKEQLDTAWQLHPHDRHWVKMLGKWVQTPRWQQAYGATYSYTGGDNSALPIPLMLKPLLDWAKNEIDTRLNGLLLNWYDGSSDYIGPHHDSTKNLVYGSPIVTMSFGETRTFRLTKWERRKKTGTRDFDASHGTVFVTPWETNKAWKHEVVKRATYHARRISVTVRAFENGVLPASEYFEAAR